MRWNFSRVTMFGICGLILVGGTVAIARQQAGAQQQTGAQQTGMTPQANTAAQTPAPEDPIKTMVSRFDLEKYKATIKGLTQFGDRLAGDGSQSRGGGLD